MSIIRIPLNSIELMELINEISMEDVLNENISEYSNPISLEIIEKIPIYITFNGYDNSQNVSSYKNYIISQNNTNNIIYNINYDFIKNLFSINGNSTEINEFIYIPSKYSQIINQEKIYDYCIFNNSNLNNDYNILHSLMNECGYTYSNNPLYCKYMFIDAFDLEKLSYVEISNIIQLRIILIAVINPDNLNNLNDKMRYLSNSILNQLFIVLLIGNNVWTNFAIDQIFKKDMYGNRKDQIEDALNKMEQNLNYFEYFIHKKNKLCPI